MIKEITSRNNDIVKYANSLKEVGFARKNRKFLIESEHLLEMASGYIDSVFTLKPLDEKMYNKQYVCNESVLEKISLNKSTRNVIAICNEKAPQPINGHIVLYLDKVQDPGNVGTIFRTALAFGINDIIVSSDTAYKYSFKVVQSSQGAIFKLNIVDGDETTLDDLKAKGYKLVSTALREDTIDISKFNFMDSQNYVIILGNEGKGIRDEIIRKSDYLVKIPIQEIDSLNVSIAGAIIMFKSRGY